MDIIEEIRQKSKQIRRSSPLDFLFSKSHAEETVESSQEKEKPSGLLNITHLGEVPLEELTTPEQEEFIELSTKSPTKIRYLKLILALIESSNYDAAISAITDLSEGSRGSEEM